MKKLSLIYCLFLAIAFMFQSCSQEASSSKSSRVGDVRVAGTAKNKMATKKDRVAPASGRTLDDVSVIGSRSEVTPPRSASPPPSPPPPIVSPAEAKVATTIEVAAKSVVMEEVVEAGFMDADGEMDIVEHEAPEAVEAVVTEKAPKARQMTAAESNDLDKWVEWKETAKENEFLQAKLDWDLHTTTHRYAVLVVNNENKAISDCEVVLKNGGTILWRSRTDNLGRAELWANPFSNQKVSKLTLEATHDGLVKTIDAKNFDDGTNEITLNTDCVAPVNAEIMFVVDATGSMGDEIAYLKSELSDVIDRVRANNVDLDLRLGSIFYRDKGDQYVTKSSKLSSNADKTIAFINKNGAGGGGDFPEAVSVALQEAVMEQDWSEDALARIVFLILDAPPHLNDNVKKKLHRTIAKAAEKGIKIIPVTASGINKTTEYIMRCFAALTNGTYNFITDDSGIGNPHLPASVNDYEVEFLNDLLVRLIQKYTLNPCDQEASKIVVIDPIDKLQSDPTIMGKVNYFPNPVVDYMETNIEEDMTSIVIMDSNGKVIREKVNLGIGTYRFDLKGIPAGNYIVKFVQEGRFASGKFVIVNR